MLAMRTNRWIPGALGGAALPGSGFAQDTPGLPGIAKAVPALGRPLEGRSQ